MSTISIQMKTHSQGDITEQFSDLKKCIIHDVGPRILDIVAGKRKEHHFVAMCLNDDCTKLSMTSAEDVVNIWNKHNSKTENL